MLQDQDDTTTDLNLTDGDDATTTTTTTVEDRGDELSPEINAAALKSVLSEAESEGATTTDEATTKPNSPFVPMVRFNQVNEAKNDLATKLAEANAELERLRAGGQPPAAAPAPAAPAPAPAVDLKAMHRQHAEALMEGDTDRAVEIAEQITLENRRIAREEIRSENAHTTVVQSLQQASDQALTDFPYLDTDEGADALELIVLARDKAIANGVQPAKALADAVAKIAPKFAPPGTPVSGLQTAATQSDNRPSNARERGARDSNLQAPIAPVGVGNRTTENRNDVANMTEAQFESLPEADKRRLRGDM